MWGYAIFTTAFVKIPQEYQWILALFSPLFRDFIFKILNFVVNKAAGDEGQRSHMMKLIPLHYMVTKHAVFLSIIVGGIATPMSSLCIMVTDFAKTMYSGGKIIYRIKVKNETNLEGNFDFKIQIKKITKNNDNIYSLFRKCTEVGHF